MSFANPAWLALLGLLPVILALHLRRRRHVTVPSLYLWKRIEDAPTERASSRMPLWSVPLLLQLLLVVLASLALAGPSLTGDGGVSHLIVLLDGSGSMQAQDVRPSRFEEARATAAARVRAGDSSLYTVILVGERPEYIAARRADGETLAGLIDGLQPGHGVAGWEAAAQSVSPVMKEAENTELLLLTDDPAAAERFLSLDATVSRQLLGGEAANFAITDLRAPVRANEDGLLEIGVTVAAFGTGDADQELELEVAHLPDGATESVLLESVDLLLADGTPTEVHLAVAKPEQDGTLQLRLVRPGASLDILPFDDAAYLRVLAQPRRLRVAHLADGESPVSRFLAGHELLEVTRIEDVARDLRSYDLVVAEGGLVTDPDELGTNFILFDWYGHDAQEAGFLADPEPVFWSDRHPLAADIQFEQLQIARAWSVPPLETGHTVLAANGGPLIQARSGRGGHGVFLSFAAQDASWTQSSAFPVFIENLLGWIEPQFGRTVEVPCLVGGECSLPAAALGGSIADPAGVSRPLLPEEASAPYLPAGIERAFSPHMPGVYTLETGRGERALAVNALGGQESLLPAGAPESGREGVPVEGGAGSFAGPSLVTILLWLSLLVLVIESFLAVAGQRGPYRPTALAARSRVAGRMRIALALRAVAVVLLVFAVAGWPLLTRDEPGPVLLVIDDPAHIPEEELHRVEGLLEEGYAAGQRLQGVVVVGGAPGELPDGWAPVGSLEGVQLFALGGGATQGGAPSSDLQAAVELARALLPGEAGRIVVASAGSETRGDVLQALGGGDVVVDLLPLAGRPAGDVAVERLVATAGVRQDQPFRLEAFVSSSGAVDAELRVYHDSELLVEQPVELREGRERIEVNLPPQATAGDHLFEVEVAFDGDPFPGNNRNGIVVPVRAAPRVAVFTPQAGWGERLAQALRLQGLDNVEVLPPSRIPHYLGHANPVINSWLDYDLAVLMNVPAIDMQFSQQELLASWVRDHGGGLVVLGGENTFGPGGYYGTPLEEVLPLSTEIPQEKPVVAVAFVLDRSGSMRQAVGEVERLDIAREATINAVELLHEESLVSVIAFDSEAHPVITMQPAGDSSTIQEQLRALEPGGGTAIFPGMQMAFEQLSQVDPELTRHIVVMTDGLSQPGEFEELIGEIREAGITVSTAAIGRGADVQLIENLARWGGGAAHITEDFEALPSILAQEALLLSDEPVQSERFSPSWGERDSAFLRGLGGDLPDLLGHVLVSARDEASVHLYAPDDTPLLASWRHGVGRVVAFASHGAGPWSEEWLEWPQYPQLMAQAARWALPPQGSSGTHLELARSGDELLIDVSAAHPTGEPWQGLDLEAVVRRGEAAPGTLDSDAAAGTEERRVPLTQVAPGSYAGSVLLGEPGSFLVEVRENPGAVTAGQLTFDPVVSTHFVAFPARHQFGFASVDRLAGLSALTGGVVLTEGQVVPDVQVQSVARNAWPLWLVTALALVLLELLLRYTSFGLGLGRRSRSGRPAGGVKVPLRSN